LLDGESAGQFMKGCLCSMRCLCISLCLLLRKIMCLLCQFLLSSHMLTSWI